MHLHIVAFSIKWCGGFFYSFWNSLFLPEGTLEGKKNRCRLYIDEKISIYQYNTIMRPAWH